MPWIKQGGAGSTCSSEARGGFADRAVEGGCFPPRVSYLAGERDERVDKTEKNLF